MKKLVSALMIIGLMMLSFSAMARDFYVAHTKVDLVHSTPNGNTVLGEADGVFQFSSDNKLCRFVLIDKSDIEIPCVIERDYSTNYNTLFLMNQESVTALMNALDSTKKIASSIDIAGDFNFSINTKARLQFHSKEIAESYHMNLKVGKGVCQTCDEQHQIDR